MSTAEERAMEALDGMTETWVERRGIAQSLESIPAPAEVRALILRPPDPYGQNGQYGRNSDAGGFCPLCPFCP